MLTSGFDFRIDEYDLKLKYKLFNLLLIFAVFSAIASGIFRIINHQYVRASYDALFVFATLIALLLSRRSLKIFYVLGIFMILVSYGITTYNFITGMSPVAGTSWYFVLIFASFFFYDTKMGLFVAVLSALTILVSCIYMGQYSQVQIFLGIIPFVVGFMFIFSIDKINQEYKLFIEIEKEELAHRAQYDWLTGISNRELFMDRLSQALKIAKRLESKVGVMFVDIDHFKEINDSYGHHAGDEVLKEVANRLNGKLRESDTLGRLGGDEFAIVINSLHKENDLENIILKLIDSMDEPIRINNHKIKVSFSLGATIYPDDATDMEQLLKNADLAMYEAKALGRNGHFIYSRNLKRH